MFQVNAEFTRITTVPLLSTFMSQLDRYTSQLMRVFKKKGGTAGRSISLIMAALDKVCILWLCSLGSYIIMIICVTVPCVCVSAYCLFVTL